MFLQKWDRIPRHMSPKRPSWNEWWPTYDNWKLPYTIPQRNVNCLWKVGYVCTNKCKMSPNIEAQVVDVIKNWKTTWTYILNIVSRELTSWILFLDRRTAAALLKNVAASHQTGHGSLSRATPVKPLSSPFSSPNEWPSLFSDFLSYQERRLHQPKYLEK